MKTIVLSFLVLLLTACGGGNYDQNTNAPINNPSSGDSGNSGTNGNNSDNNNNNSNDNTGKRKEQQIKKVAEAPETFGTGDTLYLDDYFKSNVGLPLTYEVYEPLQKGICSITGDDKNILQTITQGQCYLNIRQAGNNKYLPAYIQEGFEVPPKCPDKQRPKFVPFGENSSEYHYICVPNQLYIYPIKDTLIGTVGQEFNITLKGEKLYSQGQALTVTLPNCTNIDLAFNGEVDNNRFLTCTPTKAGESKLTISNGNDVIFSTPVLFEESKPIPPMPITKTGITTCANATESGIDCTNQSKLGDYYNVNQDGEVRSGVGHNYKTLSAANGDNCLQDSATGRIWELKTDDGGLRDKDWSYHWYSTDTNINGGDVGNISSATDKAICGDTLPNALCNSQAYIQTLNATNYCGYSDWRLPQLDELMSLVDFDKQDNPPMINNQVFNNVFLKQDPNFLTHGYLTDKAYALRFYNATISSTYGKGKIRAVRHLDSLSTPNQRYEIINNGTEVKDNHTNLVWQRCVFGQTWNGTTCSGEQTNLPWLDALKQSKALGKGYRLPSIKELISIAEPPRPRFQSAGIGVITFPHSPAYFISNTPSKTIFNSTDGSITSTTKFVFDTSFISINAFIQNNQGGYIMGATRPVRPATEED